MTSTLPFRFETDELVRLRGDLDDLLDLNDDLILACRVAIHRADNARSVWKSTPAKERTLNQRRAIENAKDAVRKLGGKAMALDARLAELRKRIDRLERGQ